MELLVVRHAQPELARPSDGPADPPLSAAGHAQARALAKWLADDSSVASTRLVSSPMRRAQETADATADACGLSVTTDARLAEFDLGASEYIPIELAGAAIHERVAAAMVTGEWGTHRFDPAAFRARVADAFTDLLVDTSVVRTVVFCHGGVINTYLATVLERPYGLFFQPRYTSVSRLAVDAAGTAKLMSLNELPHAYLLEPEFGAP